MTSATLRPLISVVIPVYNVEKYLDRCLESVVNNDYRELQIICVNDGSVDSSGEILDRWAKKDSRIQVVTQENAGASAARNVGIRLSRGDYLCFVDSDDCIAPQYFSTLLQGIVDNKTDVAVCGFLHIRNESDLKGVERPQTPPLSLEWQIQDRISYLRSSATRYSVWGKIYSKKLNLPFFNESLPTGNDVHYNITVLKNNPQLTFACCNSHLYHYCVRKDSLVNSRTAKEMKALGDYFLQSAEESVRNRDSIGEEIFVLESVKRALSIRYDLMFDRSYRKLTKEDCKRAKRILCSAGKAVSLRSKILFLSFLNFPCLYRLFRIIQDPSLLRWERGMKLRYKNSGKR